MSLSLLYSQTDRELSDPLSNHPISSLRPRDLVSNIIKSRCVIVNWPPSVKAFDSFGNLTAKVTKWDVEYQNAFLFQAVHPVKSTRTRLLPRSEGDLFE